MQINFLFIVDGYTCMIYIVKIKWFGCSHPLNRCKEKKIQLQDAALGGLLGLRHLELLYLPDMKSDIFARAESPHQYHISFILTAAEATSFLRSGISALLGL